MPTFPGMVSITLQMKILQDASRHQCFQEKFEGKIIHSSQHRTAREHEGKKVVVVGACTSCSCNHFVEMRSLTVLHQPMIFVTIMP